ncbi:MAG: hypothetical protein IZT58_17225 [Actinobacteria bacterium]|nr:hypothetical protein [Actinomycetota bacterium]
MLLEHSQILVAELVGDLFNWHAGVGHLGGDLTAYAYSAISLTVRPASRSISTFRITGEDRAEALDYGPCRALDNRAERSTG